MMDDAPASTPARSDDLDEQQGRTGGHTGRWPQDRLGQGGWEAPWLARGGHPVGTQPFSPPLPQATGHYGAGYGDPQRHFGTDGRLEAGMPHGHDEHHQHYQQYRREHERRLDEDYAAYRQQRFASEFGRWRSGRQETTAPEGESPLRSLGRAISETVTGSRDPDLGASTSDRQQHPFDAGTQREATERFFERT